ncbi:MAG: sterol desaturase family protein [Candidatus Hydrogenedentota bacterium]
MRFLVLGGTIVAVVVLERIAHVRFREAAFFRDYFTSDLIYLASALGLGAQFAGSYVTPLTEWIEAAVTFPRLGTISLPMWLSLPLAVALADLGSYVAHRLLHRSNALWEFHKVHHSARVVDWLATFRSHFVEQIIRNLFGPALSIVAGFPLDVTLLAAGVYAAFAVFNHSNTKLDLRWAEAVFVTPRLHRMHHLPDKTCQKNFGTVLTVWDRLFGTLEKRPAACEVFGVPDEVHSFPQSWTAQLLEPFRRMVKQTWSTAKADGLASE